MKIGIEGSGLSRFPEACSDERTSPGSRSVIGAETPQWNGPFCSSKSEPSHILYRRSFEEMLRTGKRSRRPAEESGRVLTPEEDAGFGAGEGLECLKTNSEADHSGRNGLYRGGSEFVIEANTVIPAWTEADYGRDAGLHPKQDSVH